MIEKDDRQKELNLTIPESVVIVGVGGTGVWTAIFLAQVGVRELILFDDDIVETHNRNRLPFSKGDVGKMKASATKKLLKERFEECEVWAFNRKFNPDYLVGSPSHIIDCTDNFESQLKINEWAFKNKLYYLRGGSQKNHITITDMIGKWDTGEEVEEKKEGV